MFYDASIPGSDDWWALRLCQELGAGFPRLHKLRRYRIGDAPLPEEANVVFKQGYAQFLRLQRLNFAEQLVVSSTGRRRPLGFRTAAPGDGNGDIIADGVWKSNHMPVQIRDLLDDEGTYGQAFLTNTGQQSNAAPFSMPVIRASNGWTTAVVKNSLRPWLVDHAIQVGHDPVLGVDILTYFRSASEGRRAGFRQAYREVRVSSIPSDGTVWYPGNSWTWASEMIPFGFTDEVPISPFETPRGIGEFEQHLDTLDRINHTILQRLTITAMQAFRTRAIAPGKDGDTFPEFYPEDHEKAGQRINYDELYESGPAALWLLPIGATMWESQTTDITPIFNAVEKDLRHLAAASSTPIHALSPDAANGSAEGANLSRETNLTKIIDRIDRDTTALARSMSFAFQALRDFERADPTKIETIWAPLDFASIEQKSLATYNARRGGMSKSFIGEKIWGLTPGQLTTEALNSIDDVFDAAAATA